MNRKTIALIGALAGVVWVLYLAQLWQTERQIALHQQHLLEALEQRNWGRFGGLIADTYADRWHHDKNFLLREPREVFRQFVTLRIEPKTTTTEIQGDAARVSARLQLNGSGGPLAELAMQRNNALLQPFVFHWKKQSWLPWDWALVEIDQPELVLSEF